jgi:geranylgeranyl pyrophosphate synthase
VSSAPARPGSGIDAVLRAGGPWLRDGLAAVEERLRELVRGAAGPLAEPAATTIAAGGKRLRPLLVLIAAAADRPGATESGGRPSREVVRAGVAVELVHSATLVHDDVLDGADLRRGRATVVAAHGRGAAAATGDLLFAQAFAELAANGGDAQLRALSRASEDLARGELLQREDAWREDVTAERYLRRCEHKTASLFEAACRLGVLTSPSPQRKDAAIEQLAGFGSRVGLAFQLLDDVLDVTGPPERTGKPRGADLLDGTVTLPLILARERDPEVAASPLRGLSAAQAEALCDRIEASGALAQTRSLALELVAEAKRRLDGAAEGSRRTLLELVAEGVVDRYA